MREEKWNVALIYKSDFVIQQFFCKLRYAKVKVTRRVRAWVDFEIVGQWEQSTHFIDSESIPDKRRRKRIPDSGEGNI